MFARLSSLFDPLVRLLLLAIVLASLFPATGEGGEFARAVSQAGIFLLFLINGLRLPRAEVLAGLRNVRFLMPLVIFVFGIMGLGGLFAARLAEWHLPATIALGFIFLGVLPSTVQSATAYTSIAKGNVANAVVAAAGLSLLGVLITAPLLALLAGETFVSLDLGGVRQVVLILLLPFFLGQLLQGRLAATIAHNPHIVFWMDRLAIALAVYVAFSGAVEQGVWQLLTLPDWGVLLGLVALMLVIGFCGSWWLSATLRLPVADRIAFQFAGAQKSIALGAPLAAIMFPPEAAGFVLLPILIYHLLQMVVSAPLAARFSRRS